VASSLCLQDWQEEERTDRPMLLTFENLSRILPLEPASAPQNLRAEPQKLERVAPSLPGLGLNHIAENAVTMNDDCIALL